MNNLLKKAIERIKTKINDIYNLITDLDCLTDNHKEFLKMILKRRFEELLK